MQATLSFQRTKEAKDCDSEERRRTVEVALGRDCHRIDHHLRRGRALLLDVGEPPGNVDATAENIVAAVPTDPAGKKSAVAAAELSKVVELGSCSRESSLPIDRRRLSIDAEQTPWW
jgi:hypothetical protein